MPTGCFGERQYGQQNMADVPYLLSLFPRFEYPVALCFIFDKCFKCAAKIAKLRECPYNQFHFF